MTAIWFVVSSINRALDSFAWVYKLETSRDYNKKHFIFPYFLLHPTSSFIFLEFSNAKDAAQAVKTANGYKLDKHHLFAVNHFEDFDRLVSTLSCLLMFFFFKF